MSDTKAARSDAFGRVVERLGTSPDTAVVRYQQQLEAEQTSAANALRFADASESEAAALGKPLHPFIFEFPRGVRLLAAAGVGALTSLAVA